MAKYRVTIERQVDADSAIAAAAKAMQEVRAETIELDVDVAYTMRGHATPSHVTINCQVEATVPWASQFRVVGG